MKLKPTTKLEMRKKATSKIFKNDVMLANYDVIVIFSIYGPFRAIRKPDSVKLTFSLTVTFLSCKS